MFRLDLSAKNILHLITLIVFLFIIFYPNKKVASLLDFTGIVFTLSRSYKQHVLGAQQEQPVSVWMVIKVHVVAVTGGLQGSVVHSSL